MFYMNTYNSHSMCNHTSQGNFDFLKTYFIWTLISGLAFLSVVLLTFVLKRLELL